MSIRDLFPAKGKLIGLMPVRNEEWILGLSMRVALMWCDELIVFDHASTDASTRIEMEVAAEHPRRVTLMRDEAPAWDEMRHRQDMLAMARARGATHIAIIDADEVLTANIIGRMNRTVKNMHPGEVMQLPLYNARHGLYEFHDNGIWGKRYASVAFVDEPKAGWTGDRFHSREPWERARFYFPVPHGAGGVMHFWGASERRLRAKHALYKVTERLRWPRKPVADIDALYSMAIYGTKDTPASEWKFLLMPEDWWRGLLDLSNRCVRLDLDPWQEKEVETMMATMPDGYFHGLDLFGYEKRLVR